MKRLAVRVVVVLGALAVLWPFAVQDDAQAWGFYAHKRINRMACYTLPPELFDFFKKHIDFITDHAADPDRRRYAVAAEAPRHYIDIDHYAANGKDPFYEVPRPWMLAVKKFSEDTLQAYGIVPWHLQVMHDRLVKAFQRLDLDRILSTAADLGHYVADAHVPLHTTENYNGQMTNQVGIHAFWESRIPELSAEGYDHFVGRAHYIDSPLDAAWDAVYASHQCVDSVLGLERKLDAEWPDDRQFTYEQRGAAPVRTQSQEFTRAYEDAMQGMVERRMNAAIITLGSFWYTAWVNAGMPDLRQLEDKDVSDSLKRVIEAENEQIRMARESLGRPEPNE